MIHTFVTVSSGGESEDGEAEYSDDWETTEETTATDSTVSVGEQSTPAKGEEVPEGEALPDLATLLANVDTKTHISEIFRRLTSH